MNLKKEITSVFNKKDFKILGYENQSDQDWECVDGYIRPFLKKLNDSADISTRFSCEGHKDEDYAYLSFNVSEKGWDIFWPKVMPELCFKFHKTTEDENITFQLDWRVQIFHNEYGRSIVITCYLKSGELRNWEEQKTHFWQEMEHSFLTHFKNC